jgi:hypothetical protein
MCRGKTPVLSVTAIAILNSTDKLQPLVIKITDVYRQKPGVIRYSHRYVHEPQAVTAV